MRIGFTLFVVGLISQVSFSAISNEEALSFDYFENNWNVIGLKDYVNGCRITPDNELLLSGKTPIQIRFGMDVTPLARKYGKRALFGWMPIMHVTTADGAVKYDFTYMGAYTVMADMIRGWHEQVVEDFYWYLLHTTAAHAFPEGIYYKDRMAWNHTIPHVTGACNYAIMLRHMLVHEAGDELHLLSAVPDWWLDEGKTIRVESAPTHFGRMDLLIRGTRKGVKVNLKRPERALPKRIVLHLPESRKLVNTIEGVDVIVRPNQKKRWDFPTVVSLHEKSKEK